MVHQNHVEVVLYLFCAAAVCVHSTPLGLLVVFTPPTGFFENVLLLISANRNRSLGCSLDRVNPAQLPPPACSDDDNYLSRKLEKKSTPRLMHRVSQLRLSTPRKLNRKHTPQRHHNGVIGLLGHYVLSVICDL